MNRYFAALAIAMPLAVAGCSCTEVYGPGELAGAIPPLKEGEISVVLAGDIMTWDRTRPLIEEKGTLYPFSATKDLIAGADLAVGNLEGPIATSARKAKKRFSYKVPPSTLAGLAGAGFDAVSFANNHTRDCGGPGVIETLSHLQEVGIGHFGAGADDRSAWAPLVMSAAGAKVALVGAVAPETFFTEHEDAEKPEAGDRMRRLMVRSLAAREGHPGTAIAGVDAVTRAISRAKNRADLVIFFPHWGIRYHRPPTAFQENVARAAIEAGADLVVGHHAHFWQPVGMHRGVPVIYGIGNFAFGSGNRRADEGLLVRAILRGGALDRVELFPTYIKNRDPKVDYQPKVMRGASAVGMLERVAKLSGELGAKLEIEGGIGIVRASGAVR